MLHLCAGKFIDGKVDGTRAAEDLFNERENKIMFVLALKRRAHL